MFNHVMDTWVTDEKNPHIPAALGLVGEAGEVTDYIKKLLYKPGYQMDEARFKDELGDLGYYIAVSYTLVSDKSPKEANADLVKEVIDTPAPLHRTNAQRTQAILTACNTIVQEAAKYLENAVMHNRSDSPDVSIVKHWAYLCKCYAFAPKEIMTANKEKLAGGRHGWPSK